MCSKHFRIWECALLFSFSLALLSGVWAAGSQSALAGDVVRLHVIAHSNSPEDQALKLQVRDAVLEAAGNCLSGVSDRTAAEDILTGRIPALEAAGAEVIERAGFAYPVTVSLTDHWFPTREYDDFALPAGTYRALRVVIGEGRGENWWCVVFPPLCLGSVTEQVETTAAMAGLSEDEIRLITGAEGYVIRFKLLEWWQSLFHGRLPPAAGQLLSVPPLPAPHTPAPG